MRPNASSCLRSVSGRERGGRWRTGVGESHLSLLQHATDPRYSRRAHSRARVLRRHRACSHQPREGWQRERVRGVRRRGLQPHHNRRCARRRGRCRGQRAQLSAEWLRRTQRRHWACAACHHAARRIRRKVSGVRPQHHVAVLRCRTRATNPAARRQRDLRPKAPPKVPSTLYVGTRGTLRTELCLF